MALVFSKDVAFIHVPKAAGSSVTKYLLEVLPPPVYYVSPDAVSVDREGLVHLPGVAHQTLREAQRTLRRHGVTLSELPLVMAVMRNPYEMAVSRYMYLRRPERPGQRFGKARDLALSLDFSDFIVQAVSRWRRFPVETLHQSYHLNGKVPSNFTMIMMENLVDGVKAALREIGLTDDREFPWLNASTHDDFASYYDQRSEAIIYSQAKWVFDRGLYPRLDLGIAHSAEPAASRAAREKGDFQPSEHRAMGGDVPPRRPPEGAHVAPRQSTDGSEARTMRASPTEATALPAPTSLIDDAYSDLRLGLFDLLPALDRDRAMEMVSDVGPLWVHADDTVFPKWLRHWGGRWQPEVGALLRAWLKPGMTVIDVGAMVGYCSRLFAQAVGPSGRVLAVEPEPRNYALLCANLWQAGALNVEPIRVAAHRVNGITAMSLSETNFGDHRAYQREAAARLIEVRSVRLDDVLRPDLAIDVVKIDAQGMDHAVIEGMEQTIKRERPMILVEFAPAHIEEFGDRPIDVLAYYRGLGLSISHLDRRNGPSASGNDAALLESVVSKPPYHTNLLLHWLDDGTDESFSPLTMPRKKRSRLAHEKSGRVSERSLRR